MPNWSQEGPHFWLHLSLSLACRPLWRAVVEERHRRDTVLVSRASLPPCATHGAHQASTPSSHAATIKVLDDLDATVPRGSSPCVQGRGREGNGALFLAACCGLKDFPQVRHRSHLAAVAWAAPCQAPHFLRRSRPPQKPAIGGVCNGPGELSPARRSRCRPRHILKI